MYMQGLQDILQRNKHVNWAMMDQILVSGVNFITTILLARFIGVEEFGIFSLVWMAILFANSFQHALILAPLMSLAPNISNNIGQYCGTLLIHQIVLSTILSGFFFAFGTLIWTDLSPDLLLPAIAALFIWQLQELSRKYFYTFRKPSTAVKISAVKYLAQISFIIFAWKIEKNWLDASNVLWIVSFSSMLSVIYALFHLEGVNFKKETFLTTTQQHWLFSKWLAGSVVLQWVSGNMLLVMCGIILGPVVLGAFRAAQSLVGAANVLFQALENIAPIQAAQNFKLNGRVGLISYLNRLSILGGSGTVLFVAVLAVFPNFWMELFFGPEYSGYGNILIWFSVIYCVVFASIPIRIGLRTLKQSKPIFWGYVVSTVFTALAAYPLIVSIGQTGVALGILVSQLIGTLICWFSLKHVLLANISEQ